MATFQYKGYNLKGSEVKGYIEAENMELAKTKVKSRNIFIEDIYEDTAKRDRGISPFISKFLYRIPRKEIGIFCKQLGTLLGAGIAIDIALKNILEQTQNIYLQRTINAIRSSIIEGESLSQAFSKHKDIFPPVYEHMIKVGEVTGSYEKTLHRLSELEEKNEELKNKIFTAMIYPLIMSSVAISVVLFLLIAVIPQVESLFLSFDANLPLMTKIVLGLSSFFQKFWSVIIIAFFLIIWGLQASLKNSDRKLKMDIFIIKIPIFGELIKKVQVSRFSRNLGTLLETKVSFLNALNIIKNATNNLAFQKEIAEMATQVKIGSSIKNAISTSLFLSEMAKAMISAGEATDTLDKMLLKTADITEKEVDSFVKKLTTALEPIMLIVMGGVVFGIMVSIMLPIYELTKQIR